MFIQRLRKYSKPLICIGGCLLFVVGTFAFAQGTDAALQNKLNDAEFMDQAVKFMAWFWIPLAMIAGKLMTNTFVFGGFMNFDIYLRGMWNISKVFANLMVGFFFLGWIYTIIFSPEKRTGSETGKTIGGLLLAGVLIQASWFLVGALLDVESITTAAAGSLPALVIQDDSDWGKSIATEMRASNVVGNKISLDKDSKKSLKYSIDPVPGVDAENISNAAIIDSVLPSYNSLSGPLYFIGFSIFRFQNYASVPFTATNNIQDVSQVLTATTIRILVQFAFAILMLLLVIVNVIRIGYLWVIIALSPIIILLLVMQGIMGIEILKKIEEGSGLKFDLQTIFAYVFQPTIIVLFMSLTLIAVTALLQGLGTGDIHIQDYAGLTITNTGATHTAFEFSSQGDMFDNLADDGRGIFKNLMMMGLVFALLIGMITLSAASLKIEFLGNIAKSLKKALVNIPMIPIATMQTFGKNELAKAGINLSAGNINFDQKGADNVRDMLGLQREIPPVDANELGKLVNNPLQFFNKVQDIRDKRKGAGISLNQNPAFKENLVKLINNIKGEPAYGFSTIEEANEKLASDLKIEGDVTIDNLKEYLSVEQNHQALYQWMYNDKYDSKNKLNTRPAGSKYFGKLDDIMEEKFIKEKTKPS